MQLWQPPCGGRAPGQPHIDDVILDPTTDVGRVAAAVAGHVEPGTPRDVARVNGTDPGTGVVAERSLSEVVVGRHPVGERGALREGESRQLVGRIEPER